MKLGQGNIFTGVCDSVNRGVGVGVCFLGGICSWGGCLVWGCLLPGGVCSRGVSAHRGVCSRGGVCSQGGLVETAPPPGRLLLRTVRILLECILVCDFSFSTDRVMPGSGKMKFVRSQHLRNKSIKLKKPCKYFKWVKLMSFCKIKWKKIMILSKFCLRLIPAQN